MLASPTMACWSCPATLLRTPLIPFLSFPQLCKHHPSLPITTTTNSTNIRPLIITNCSDSTMSTTLSWSETEQESSEEEEEEEEDYEESTEDDEEKEEEGEGRGTSSPAAARTGHAPPLIRRRRRYRKQYPGEKKGITEEMRFVAMKLRNSGKPKKAKKDKNKANKSDDNDDGKGEAAVPLDEENGGAEDNQNGESWEPSMEGFLKYLVDSKLVFSTVERIVDESSDVSYAYFRKTGLERAERLSKDLEWFSQQGNSIPEPSNPGVTYAKYLEELAENSPPLFMCHFYNIYFSHIAGGQVIAREVSKKLLEGRELEFFKWEGNEEELLRDTREKLNMIGEHWSRDEKNKCLRESTKAFRFLGQIVRLIIL